MKLDEMLIKLGCRSVDATSARFIGDGDFYREVVTEMLKDPGFDELGKEIDSKNAKTAFETSHMLKGVIANCGISPMYDVIVKIVELLRNGDPDYDVLKKEYSDLLDKRNTANDALAD